MVGTRPAAGTAGASAGRILRSARRRQQLTLDEIAATLRIPPKYLRSLEEGDLSVFAAEVYARGAYVKYAQHLGVDGQQTHHAFLRSLSVGRERVPLKLPQTASRLARALTHFGVLVFSVSLGVLVVALYLGWHVQSFIRLPFLELSTPQSPVLDEPQVTVRGRADSDAHVKINGETVLLGDQGAFEYILPLRFGINVIQVEATGVSGRTRVIQRDVLVPRS